MSKKIVKLLKTTISASLCLLLILSLVACGATSTTPTPAAPSDSDTSNQSSSATSESPAPSTSDGPVTITLWTGFTGSDRAVLEGLFKEYNDSQNEVNVEMEIIDWEILYQRLTAVAATDQGPDFIIFGPENIANYVDIGLIAPIDDFYEQNRIDRSLFPTLFETLIRYNDHYVGIPMNFFSFVLYYNKDLASEAGLDVIFQDKRESFS